MSAPAGGEKLLMHAWRIARAAFAKDKTGEGASRYGGRWNQANVPAIYGGLSIEIAALEKYVHTRGLIPDDLKLVRLTLPDDPELIARPKRQALPKTWDALPSSPAAAAYGSRYLQEGRYLALIVPSVVIPEALNIIINPRHAEFRQVKFRVMRDFGFDSRM